MVGENSPSVGYPASPEFPDFRLHLRDGHLFITVLAYQFVQIIRNQLKQKDICGSWSSLRDTLSSQCRITATFSRADGRVLHVRKATRAEPEQTSIYQALGINATPGETQKTTI